MRKVLFVQALLLLCICTRGQAADLLVIKSHTPGNIIAAGAPLNFTVSGASGAVTYRLQDYFGHEVTNGTAALSGATADFVIRDLKPGYYELTCKSGESTATTTAGVLIDRGNLPPAKAGHLGVDAAAGWLVKQQDLKSFVQMARLAGIPWVRERLAWGEMEPQQGKFAWQVPNRSYEELAGMYAAAGIAVQENWGDSPDWARQAGVKSRCPSDMRTVYNFAKAVSQRYTGRVQSWEICNEPEYELFWDDLSDRYAGYIKAAFLGSKAGNPSTPVFPGALCVGYSTFGQHAFDSLPGYADGFGWHVYQSPDTFEKVFRSYDPIRKSGKLIGKPIRLTEVGIRTDVVPNSRNLSPENRRVQCQFIPRFAAHSLMLGCDKALFFVMPDYMEGTLQFGLLRADLTPNPAFVAISAAINIIGEGKYLGQYPLTDHGASAFLFDTPKGNVLVAWAEHPTAITIPVRSNALHVTDIFGAERSPIPAQGGMATVSVGPDAVYLSNIGDSIRSHLAEKRKVERPSSTAQSPSKVVLVGHDNHDHAIDLYQDSYTLNAGADAQKLSYTVDVYNFDDKVPASGTVAVSAPKGWQVTPGQQTVELAPMDRKQLSFTVTAPPLNAFGPYKVEAKGKFGKEELVPTRSYFDVSANTLLPIQSKPFSLVTKSTDADWVPHPGTTGQIKVSQPSANLTRFAVHMNDQQSRAVYAELKFAHPVNISQYEAIAFDYKTNRKLDDGSFLHIRFRDAQDSLHCGAWMVGSDKPVHVVVFFKDLQWFPTYSDKPLDLHAVTSFCVGGDFAHLEPDVTLDLSNVELVKFAHAAK